MLRSFAVALLALVISSPSLVFAAELALKAPPGFTVSLYAGDELAHDIYSLTLDGQGRVVVSGPGYIKALVDSENRGRADKATLLSSLPKSGAFGMCFAGNDLLYTGDNGLFVLRNVGDTSHAPVAPEKWVDLKSTEHGSHSIVQGPDGWFYVNCGNDTKITEQFITSPNSPIKKPLAGCVLRFSPDGKKCECVADGLRNACGLAFNQYGSLFTVDSDGERDQYLPWYTPTRLFELRQGAHHGWVNEGWQASWNRPASWFDSVPPLAYIGRGSPTGVAVYRHHSFPEHYRGGVFSCCWTLGRVYYFPLTPSDEGYTTKQEIFLESLGGSGFAPTDIAVGPAGELYISTGGRGTQGGVYVVRATGEAAASPPSRPTDALSEILSAPQPLAAWSRAKWLPEAKKIEARVYRQAMGEASRSLGQRLRAIEILTELYDGCTAADVERCQSAGNDGLTARAKWSNLRRRPNDDPPQIAEEETTLADDVTQFEIVRPTQWKIAAIRRILLLLGDVNSAEAQPAVFIGYVPKVPGKAKVDAELKKRLAAAFPTGDAELNRELARLLAVLEVDSAEPIERIAAMPSEKSSVPDDLHYLIVLARLPAARSDTATKATAAALARLHHKMADGELYPSRNWPDRVGELFEALCKRDENLAPALLDDSHFNLPAQAMFGLRLPKALQAKAAERLLAAAKKDSEARWTPEFVRLVANLPADTALPALRAQWNDFTLRDTIVLELTKVGDPSDRARYLEGLASAEPKVVEQSAIAMANLEDDGTVDDITAVMRTLRQYCQAPKYTGLRSHLVVLLVAWSGEEFEINDKGQGNLLEVYEPWFSWFAMTYPDAAEKLKAEGTVDLAEWSRRLDKVAWDDASAERGRLVFERRNCFKCHAGASKFGPDLAGAAGRFSRQDLFTAILDPNKDVSPLFRTTQVVTGAGKVTTGVIVYESPESTLVQTGPEETVRIAGEEIVAMRPSRQSLMPQGLLNGASDAELADLYAYLKTLGVKKE